MPDRRYTYRGCGCGDAWCSGCAESAAEHDGNPGGTYLPPRHAWTADGRVIVVHRGDCTCGRCS